MTNRHKKSWKLFDDFTLYQAIEKMTKASTFIRAAIVGLG